VSRRRSLGRGLDALIPSAEAARAEKGERVVQLAVDGIQPNPRQPRQQFNPDELQGLADSIAEHGVLQPLVVAKSSDTDGYVLIAGQRRLQAARMAGLAEVPVVLRQATEQQLLEWALIENLQREDLNPIEAARGYQQLVDDFGLSHEAIAGRVGKSRSAVSNTLRLLKLTDDTAMAVLEGRISEGHARALLGLDSPRAQDAALQTIVKRDLNVRQAEELVRKLSGERRAKPARTKRSPEEAALEEELQQSLGTRVKLRRGRRGGTLTLHFFSDEELEALVERLKRSG
jgi:ParB family transcriptional regulator, chromosome partitioning protein